MSLRPAKPTIRDVARVAGVSIGTVSRVLNRSNKVGAPIREAVQKAIDELNYVPNAVAQSMRSRSTMTVGCIVREIIIPPLAEFVRAAQTLLEEAGYSLVLSNSGGVTQRESVLIDRLISRQIDGLMIASYSQVDPQFEAYLKGLNVPLVIFDRHEPAWADAVMVDHASGMEKAVGHLLDLGHRQIMLISGQESLWPAKDRVRGYRAAFAARGLTPDPEMIRSGSFLSEAGYRLTSSSLGGKTPPTAIIAGGLDMLPGVIRAIRVRGLRIPEDISVIGTGESELAEFHTPQISIQSWDQSEMGAVAGRLLLDRIANGPDGEPQRILLPSTFLMRGSTGPARPR